MALMKSGLTVSPALTSMAGCQSFSLVHDEVHLVPGPVAPDPFAHVLPARISAN